MPRLYIQYKDNNPISIFTQNIPVPVGEKPVVADLIGAFKTAVAPRFDSTPTDELTLHEVVNGVELEALRPGRALSDVTGGKTDDNPLIIKSSHHLEAPADQFDTFEKAIGRRLSALEQKTLISQFRNEFDAIRMAPSVLPRDVRKLLAKCHAFALSETAKSYVQEHNIVVNGLLGRAGQTQTTLRIGFDLAHGSICPVCIKGYDLSDKEMGLAFKTEDQASRAVHQNGVVPTIVQYLKSFTVDHVAFKGQMGALVMHQYPASLQDLLNGTVMALNKNLMYRLGLTLLHASYVFASLSMAHCDIKPSNIVIDANGDFTVIDLGSVVDLGGKVLESTPGYSRNANSLIVTEEFDFACILSTLSCCADRSFKVQPGAAPALPVTQDASGVLGTLESNVRLDKVSTSQHLCRAALQALCTQAHIQCSAEATRFVIRTGYRM